MPTITRTDTINKQLRQFDVRPDRIDFRDRPYRPPLVSLPPQYPEPAIIEVYLPKYCADDMLLDQGSEGACTGFGLAAVINYLFWEQAQQAQHQAHPKVSTRMLYQTAKLYDEWQGEDYEGSSCRGAMKGWHRHGVCEEKFWPYWVDGMAEFVEPQKGWDSSASEKPLGAYYRIDKNSILEMQAAIQEVHAIYASAQVHQGWFLDTADDLPIIKYSQDITGGHAFAIVGYNETGFIVQNSWGKQWGFNGFAMLQYQDWIQHGMDAWVAVLGAPIKGRKATETLTSSSLHALPVDQQQAAEQISQDTPALVPETAPWPESEAYKYTLVLGNQGRSINRLIEANNANRALEIVSYERPLIWLQDSAAETRKLAIFAHGGLNNEKSSIQRIRIMAPYFQANGIYPLFITWRTGALETLRNILDDALESLGLDLDALRAEGLFSEIGQLFLEARDRSLEVTARSLLGKAVWTEMKENAAAGASREGGLNKLADQLKRLQEELPSLEIHLIGHSAGSILLGHLLTRMTTRDLKAHSMTLYAPACTVEFAVDQYGKAFKKGTLNKKTVTIELLSDKLERADSVGPYGKSLLYLVSRALEQLHKTPLLGMERAWDIKDEDDLWHSKGQKDIKTWRKLWGNQIDPSVHHDTFPPASNGKESIPRNHGHFDNEINVLTKTLQIILGQKPKHAITNLRGF